MVKTSYNIVESDEYYVPEAIPNKKPNESISNTLLTNTKFTKITNQTHYNITMTSLLAHMIYP